MSELQTVQQKRKLGRPRKEWVGRKFGLLTVIEDSFTTGTNRKLLCRCECGEQSHVFLSNLVSGQTVSCGCYSVRSFTLRPTMKDRVVYREKEDAECRRYLMRRSYLEGGSVATAAMIANLYNVSISYANKVLSGLRSEVRRRRAEKKTLEAASERPSLQ